MMNGEELCPHTLDSCDSGASSPCPCAHMLWHSEILSENTSFYRPTVTSFLCCYIASIRYFFYSLTIL